MCRASSGATDSRTTMPDRVRSPGSACITLGRTVAICGRKPPLRMVAMMLPPKAGRVWSRSPVSGSMASPVQSAVSPA